MDNKEAPKQWKINSVIKATNVLKLFDGMNPNWAFNELVEKTKIPKSTMSNILKTLESVGLIEKNKNSQVYHLGLEILEMGYSARKAIPIIETAQPYLDNIREKTGEIVYFTVPKNGKVLYLEASYPQNKNISYSITGKTLNMHCTGVGKAMLSKLSIEAVKEIIEYHGMQKFTSTTITDIEELIIELEKVRERGYAIDLGEEAYGVKCVAVPIVAGHDLIGALSISGSTLSMKEENFDSYATYLMEVANVLADNKEKFPLFSILPREIHF